MATREQNSTPSRPSSARQRASSVGDQLGSTVEGSPRAARAAGAVVGGGAGALLPRTDKETELLGPVGSRIGQAAAEAAKAARDAGKQELGLLGESKSPVEMLADKAVGALQAAGSAAGNAAASKVTGKQEA